MHRTTITGKGQVTIPAAIRERFGLKNGDVLEFVADEENSLKVHIVRHHSASELRGIFKTDKPYPGSFDDERRSAQEAVAEAHRPK